MYWCWIRQSRPNVERTLNILATFLQQKSPAFDQVEHDHLCWQCRPQRAVKLNFVGSLYGGWQSRNDVSRDKYSRSTVVRQSQTSRRQSTFDKRATKLQQKRDNSTFEFMNHVEFDFVTSAYRALFTFVWDIWMLIHLMVDNWKMWSCPMVYCYFSLWICMLGRLFRQVVAASLMCIHIALMHFGWYCDCWLF